MSTTLNANTRLPSQFNRDHDKPAMLGTKHSAFDTPSGAEEDLHFDHEMRGPMSTDAATALAVGTLLAAGLMAVGAWWWL